MRLGVGQFGSRSGLKFVSFVVGQVDSEVGSRSDLE